MPSEKKKTKEDTWTPSDLKKTILKDSVRKSQSHTSSSRDSSIPRKNESDAKVSKAGKDEHSSKKKDGSSSRHKKSEREKEFRHHISKEINQKQEEKKISKSSSKNKVKNKGEASTEKKSSHYEEGIEKKHKKSDKSKSKHKKENEHEVDRKGHESITQSIKKIGRNKSGSEEDALSKKTASIATSQDDYNYDDEEFEDYEEDFEESDEEKSESSGDIKIDSEHKQQQDETSSDSEAQFLEDEKKLEDEFLEEEKNSERKITEETSNLSQKLQKRPKELEEIRKAITAENEQINLSRQNLQLEKSSSSNQNVVPVSKQHSFINFSSHKKQGTNAQISSQIKKRGLELLHLIDLDVISTEILDIAPLKEYDLYMRSFGRLNTQQVYIQTNEDNIDKEVQTDDCENLEKWTQHPADYASVCGGNDDNCVNANSLSSIELDSSRLNQFVHDAGQVMMILLEEESLEKKEVSLTNNRSPAAISEGFVQLKCPLFLKDHEICFVFFSPVQPNVLLTIHNISQLPESTDICLKSVICIWNVYEASRPQKILASSSQAVCCCLNPLKTSLAFAGMADGTLAAWDLREPVSMHSCFNYENEQYLLRLPTYNTAWLLHNNHLSPITCIQVLLVANEDGFNTSASKDGFNSGLSYQLASLEKNGIIHFWTVVEIPKSDPAGSLEDLGLSPNGRIKLVKSSTLDLNIFRRKIIKDFIQVFEMQLNPVDTNHMYIGSGQGYVLHAVRYGGKVAPKMYRAKRYAPINVVSIDFCPFLNQYFIVGCEDGSLRIHSIHIETPILAFSNSADGEKLVSAQWSRSRACVFYALFNQSKLHTWDLMQREDEPIRIEHFAAGRVTCFGLSHHFRSLHGNHSPLMVAGFDKGQIEVHQLKEEFRKAKPDEVPWLQKFLEDKEL